jgi:hypothetical protein
MVVEVDGSQHTQGDNTQKDRIRDAYFSSLGLKVLRFNSREVLEESDAVISYRGNLPDNRKTDKLDNPLNCSSLWQREGGRDFISKRIDKNEE